MNCILKFSNILIALSACHTIDAVAQSTLHDAPTPTIFRYVGQMPKTGYDVGEYLGKNIHYPDSAKAHNITGRVIIRFIVNEDGHISDCKAMTNIGEGLEEEAIRVISAMPNWVPGRQDGVPVKVYFTQPIAFKLDDEKDMGKAK